MEKITNTDAVSDQWKHDVDKVCDIVEHIMQRLRCTVPEACTVYQTYLQDFVIDAKFREPNDDEMVDGDEDSPY